jgi:glycyl-tRNA synthetase beta chain
VAGIYDWYASTGSGDPFALRRAANGIVQIISHRKWDFNIFALADEALN